MDIELVKKHFGVEFVDTFSKGLDYYVYEESTADGYSIWVATSTPNNVSINDDVYYYDSDVACSVAEAIKDGAKKIYCEDIPGIEIFEEIANELIDDIK
jgi:hypothetical protein